MKSIKLSPVLSLVPFLGDGELVAFDVGPDGMMYLVIALKPLDYRRVSNGGASFAKTKPDQPQSYRVIGLHGATTIIDIVIMDEQFNVHFIQPLIDELLLVCARSRYVSSANKEKNGRIYSRTGKWKREILLGDGIQSVQTTSNGMIWTSYFDEGVFGNFGWDHPLGQSGLVAWNASGKKLYDFESTTGLDSICDCYALNVVSDTDTWLYYYTEFPLVHLHQQKVVGYWNMPVRGSNTFAIAEDLALFTGGYNHRDTYQLFQLGSHCKLQPIAEFKLLDQAGKKLTPERVVGRGDTIYLLCDSHVYLLDVQTALVTFSL